jgi:hypothetical protein
LLAFIVAVDAGRVGPGSPHEDGKDRDIVDEESELDELSLWVESGRCVLLTVVLLLMKDVALGGGSL